MPATSKNICTSRQSPRTNDKAKLVAKGRYAEALVSHLLQLQGWEILRQNYRVKHAEIDIIARKHITVIFVEVKFRSFLNHPRYLESLVNPGKIKALRYGANSFISKAYPAAGLNFRFDLALVDQHGQITYHVGFIE